MATQQFTAKLRYVSIPPRKMRLVANLVKGMPIQKALDVLNFTKRVAATPIAKTLKSAAANAMSQLGTGQGAGHIKAEDLVVKNLYVDPAPSAKRIRFQSMGRVFRYRKRFCHLTVVLEEKGGTHVVAPATTKDKGKTVSAATVKAAAKKKAAPAKKTAKKTAKPADKKKPAAKKPAKKSAKK
jgi:large subunit ribosomal protein L22